MTHYIGPLYHWNGLYLIPYLKTLNNFELLSLYLHYYVIYIQHKIILKHNINHYKNFEDWTWEAMANHVYMFPDIDALGKKVYHEALKSL